mgnify:CR=1 FL=1
MLSCKDVSRLNSQAQDRCLTRRERWGVRLHLLVCKGCREFARRLHTLRAACKQLEQASVLSGSEPALKADSKSRIRQALALQSKNKSQ